jgi:hypothetical protein
MPDENKKLEKKLVKKYDVLLASEALIRQVPSVLGPF